MKLPTIWTVETEVGRVREGKKGDKVRRKKMQVRAKKIEKSRFTAFFQ